MADDDTGTLLTAARAMMERAYAPYSHFHVGAAILGESGRVHSGANVENAAYPQGQCAETSAIGAMIAAGDRRIRAIAVMGAPWRDGAPLDSPALCTPCGGCRQRIREFAAPDTPVHVCGPEGLRRTFTVAELLPESFGPDNLEF